MPSVQKIVLALAFVASTFAAQISDGQIQQPTSVVTPVPVVKQITDGQIQQATSTPAPVTVTPAVKQITDGQIQQVTSTPPVVTPPVKQITDGQIQQVSSARPATVTPPVKQITDGQIQQVASASKAPVPSSNGTTVTKPSAPVATFQGAASLMSYSKDLVVVAIGAAAVFAVL